MRENDSFTYLTAHDLRAPLMSVKGLLNLIKMDPERKNQDQYFKLLERSIDRMNQSINNILSYSKNGSVKMLLEEVDLKKIAEDAIQSLYFMKGAEHVSIILAIENVKFISDYKALFAIFSNIISNAIRFRDADKAAFLNISATANSEDVEISFEDNGIGMDESLHRKIFEKFSFEAQEQGSTGLGLYIVKRSVEKLDGEIQVQSKPGVGTTFTIQIPKLFRKE